ncbi:hypothetical protein LOAG_12247 [Loa loa]|uniref:Uncharacterized protein n=1 Tax=Loa loa TaxID=7209 RepID=A0A1S0TLN1_LOALO|nr:hypothetical protein LOAG_12247 [Loa loa]EFO16260.1 hypothetical protein LOAG_12247 [Loa loa]
MNVMKEGLEEIEYMEILKLENKIIELVKLWESDAKSRKISAAKNEMNISTSSIINNNPLYLVQIQELLKEIRRIDKRNKFSGRKQRPNTFLSDSNIIHKTSYCKICQCHTRRKHFHPKRTPEVKRAISRQLSH